MGAYEDLIRDTAEAVMQPGRPVSLDELAPLVAGRLYTFSRDELRPPVDVIVLYRVLRSDPTRFLEVAPGVWMRRADGPEAGVPSRRKWPPFAGSAAAAVTPQEEPVMVDAVGGPGGRASPAT